MGFTREDRKRVRTAIGERSRTKQADAESADVNKIMERYVKTGQLNYWNQRQPHYGDNTLATSLQEALDLVADAMDAFDQLPSKVRNAAHNEPVLFLEMMADPAGFQRLVDAGLAMEPKPAPGPSPAPEATKAAPEAEPTPSKPAGESPTGAS